jgi:hypothetical protein
MSRMTFSFLVVLLTSIPVVTLAANPTIDNLQITCQSDGTLNVFVRGKDTDADLIVMRASTPRYPDLPSCRAGTGQEVNPAVEVIDTSFTPTGEQTATSGDVQCTVGKWYKATAVANDAANNVSATTLTGDCCECVTSQPVALPPDDDTDDEAAGDTDGFGGLAGLWFILAVVLGVAPGWLVQSLGFARRS